MHRIFAIATLVCLCLALAGVATAQTQSTCQTWLATDPNPSGIPAVSGPGVTQRSDLLAAGGKLVAISGRYYSVSIPAAFYSAELPVLIFDLHGTNGYPEPEWNDWYPSMSTRGFALIALSWGGGTPTAATDTQVYAQLKQIVAELSAHCPLANARKYLLGFSVGSAISFAVMIRDVADQKMFRGQLAISGAAASPLVSGRDVMHATVEANRSNPTALQGVKSWMYCGVLDHDHYYPDPSSWWSMCDEMPNGEAFVNQHGGSATLYQDPAGTHHSLSSSPAGYNLMYDFVVAQDAQTITFEAVAALVLGQSSSLSASASSGLPVTLSSATPTICSVSGSTLAGLAVGTCTLTASQSGNASFAAATAVTQSTTVIASTSRLINVSTRGKVLTGDNVMIGGFIIQGNSPQTVLIRAGGPSLSGYGVSDVLANPKLDLYAGQTVIASNDDWGAATNAAAITASGLAPAHALESALLITLQPGAYTAIVSGADGGSGTGIVEVFAQ